MTNVSGRLLRRYRKASVLSAQGLADAIGHLRDAMAGHEMVQQTAKSLNQ